MIPCDSWYNPIEITGITNQSIAKHDEDVVIKKNKKTQESPIINQCNQSSSLGSPLSEERVKYSDPQTRLILIILVSSSLWFNRQSTGFVHIKPSQTAWPHNHRCLIKQIPSGLWPSSMGWTYQLRCWNESGMFWWWMMFWCQIWRGRHASPAHQRPAFHRRLDNPIGNRQRIWGLICSAPVHWALEEEPAAHHLHCELSTMILSLIGLEKCDWLIGEVWLWWMMRMKSIGHDDDRMQENFSRALAVQHETWLMMMMIFPHPLMMDGCWLLMRQDTTSSLSLNFDLFTINQLITEDEESEKYFFQ